MSYLHGSPSVRLRRETGPGDASPDALNIADIAASRAAWKRSGGKYIVEAGELRFNPRGWPEPERPVASGNALRCQEARATYVANMEAAISAAVGRRYKTPPTTRGSRWFAVGQHHGHTLRFPLSAHEAACAVCAGMQVMLGFGRKGFDQ